MGLGDGNYSGGPIVKTYHCPRCKNNLLSGVTRKLAENSFIYWKGTHVFAKCGKCGTELQMWEQSPCPCRPWGDFLAKWLGMNCAHEATCVLAYLKHDSATNSDLVYFDYLCKTHYQERLAGKKHIRVLHLGELAVGGILMAGAVGGHLLLSSQQMGNGSYCLSVPIGIPAVYLLWRGLLGVLPD